MKRWRSPSAPRARAFVAASVATLAAAACAGSRAPSTGAPNRLDAGDRTTVTAAVRPAFELASFDELTSRAAAEAPLMREILRSESAGAAPVEFRGERDTCVRALFTASSKVRAAFVDEAGAPRGEASPSASGVVPPRGPVCVRKGERLRLVLTASDASDRSAPVDARAIVLAAPSALPR